MEYKKKYNEALERARQFIEHPLQEDSENIVEYIFPELKESEDERIRKGIIDFIKHESDTYGIKTWCHGYTTEEIIAWLEKQGEQTTDKIESKFKVSDWVILNGIVAKILDKQKYGFVGLDVDGNDFFCNYGHTDSMRLWSINDAKNGDMLVDEDNNIGIYSGEKDDLYGWNSCIYLSCNNKLYLRGYHEHKNTKPATKEQRVLLFEEMAQAGYEWDADKKELKKMEVASKEGDDERIRKAIHIYLDWLDGRKDYQPKGVYTIRDMIDWVIKQDKKISADKVIEWLNHRELSRDDVVTSVIPDDSPTSVPHRVKWLSDEFIKQFKKDFGL